MEACGTKMARAERQIAERAKETSATLASHAGAFLRVKKAGRLAIECAFARGGGDARRRTLKRRKEHGRELAAAGGTFDGHAIGGGRGVKRERTFGAANRARWRGIRASHANKVCLP